MMTVEDIRQDRLMEWSEPEGVRSWHTIVLMNYGRCVYWLDRTKVILEKGDVLFIPQGASYYAKSVPSVFHEKYVVQFVSGEGAVSLPWLSSGRWIHLKPAMFEWAAERLRLMADEWRDKAAFADIRGQAILTELLALWHRQSNEGPVTATTDHHAQRMKDYILEHYRERVTKESLGDYIGVSPNYAAALFRRATGQTISDYVHATRIKKAMYLLADSLLTVGEISDLLGYRDVSYFHRLFKRSTGKNPSEFMKDRSG